MANLFVRLKMIVKSGAMLTKLDKALISAADAIRDGNAY